MDNQNNINREDFKIYHKEGEDNYRAICYMGGNLTGNFPSLPSVKPGGLKQMWADGKTEEESINNLIKIIISCLS